MTKKPQSHIFQNFDAQSDCDIYFFGFNAYFFALQKLQESPVIVCQGTAVSIFLCRLYFPNAGVLASPKI
ncbi:hypothetical protein [Microcoleus sp. FACHB-68]|uniref:hypothetical protein n=1 Tax=Microcoleus sp. FACHB-68 TaxID=2692826 RepID=UPI001685D55F|nr:hypothetical protein [Microcoleus sp. FACHB-68]MBD1939731.1 hypothetical protein [Microcoleus sp. FACHB-68]